MDQNERYETTLHNLNEEVELLLKKNGTTETLYRLGSVLRRVVPPDDKRAEIADEIMNMAEKLTGRANISAKNFLEVLASNIGK